MKRIRLNGRLRLEKHTLRSLTANELDEVAGASRVCGTGGYVYSTQPNTSCNGWGWGNTTGANSQINVGCTGTVTTVGVTLGCAGGGY